MMAMRQMIMTIILVIVTMTDMVAIMSAIEWHGSYM